MRTPAGKHRRFSQVGFVRSPPILQVASANRLIVGAALASSRCSIKFFVDESCSSLTFFRLSTQEAPPEIPNLSLELSPRFQLLEPTATTTRLHTRASLRHCTFFELSSLDSHIQVQLRPSWSSTPGLLHRKSINGWGSPQAYPGSWDSPVFEQNIAEGVVPALPEGSLAAPIVSVAKHNQFDSDEEDQSNVDMPPLQTPPDSETVDSSPPYCEECTFVIIASPRVKGYFCKSLFFLSLSLRPYASPLYFEDVVPNTTREQVQSKGHPNSLFSQFKAQISVLQQLSLYSLKRRRHHTQDRKDIVDVRRQSAVQVTTLQRRSICSPPMKSSTPTVLDQLTATFVGAQARAIATTVPHKHTLSEEAESSAEHQNRRQADSYPTPMEEDKVLDKAEPLGDAATVVAHASTPPSVAPSEKSSPDSEIFLSNCETIAVLSLYSTLSSDMPGLDEPLFKVDAQAQAITNSTPHK
ncbi:hypothetical protein K435DRAFT_871428 [Dendrothele bispora CBS 962.96]|uniref:Uncharacterized protein n=1 Tax=Dendrothele bispora (strain CBS 962.96) TaxID=1314807 RepID=A0A4S8L5G3_DENBC|nr:hypothetical protein K435DRAFT_871428 [Dendrothele bispora CBS 962.96]